MYAYRHKIVFNGKLEKGTPGARMIGIENGESSKSIPGLSEGPSQSTESSSVIEQLRILHLAVVRAKKLTVKELVS